MQHLFKLPFGLFAASLLLFAGASQAAPKVDICHFEEETGIFEPLAVSSKAVQPHLGHGDVLPGVDNEPPLPDLDEECMPIIPTVILAVAYIDVIDDSAGYDPTVDLEIAIVFDSDATPGLSVGDTVEFGAYPTTFDPCPDPSCPNVGTFTTNTTQTVSTVGFPVTQENLEFDTSGGLTVVFQDFTDIGFGHFFRIINVASTARILQLIDDITNPEAYNDRTALGASGILTPSTPPHDISRSPILTDDPFVDVEIY